MCDEQTKQTLLFLIKWRYCGKSDWDPKSRALCSSRSRVINLPSLPGTGLALARAFSQKTPQARAKHRRWWSCDPLAACVCSLPKRLVNGKRPVCSSLGFQLDVANGKQLHAVSERKKGVFMALGPLNHHASQTSATIRKPFHQLLSPEPGNHFLLSPFTLRGSHRTPGFPVPKYCVISCLFLKSCSLTM